MSLYPEAMFRNVFNNKHTCQVIARSCSNKQRWWKRSWRWLAFAGAVILSFPMLLPVLVDTDRLVRIGDEGTCRNNLTWIYWRLSTYFERNGELPRRDGIRFFAYPSYVGGQSPTSKDAQRWNCPASPRASDAIPQWELRQSIDEIDSKFFTYAGRSMSQYPLAALHSMDPRIDHELASEPLVACKCQHESEAGHFIHVLYANGAIRKIVLESEKTAGRIPEDRTRIVVGPNADLPELRKLALD